jgi:Tol biopolymer transport system component
MVCASPGGDVLTFVDARSGDRKITEIRGRNPRFSPDGARIVFEHRGDIALLDLASQRVTELTKNTFSERAPRFSDDGSHVYFESRQIDPNFSRRMASVVARVAVPR